MTKIKTFTFLIVVIFLISSCNEDDIESTEETTEETTEEPEIISSEEFQHYHITPDSLFQINRIVELNDNSFALAGGVTITGGTEFTQNVIIKIDEIGIREWTSVMANSVTPNGLEGLFIQGNNFTGYRSSSYSDRDEPSLINFNENGNAINEIPIENSVLGHDILKVEDGYLVTSDHNDFELQKLTENGMVDWTVTIGDKGGKSLSKLPDGNYITIGGSTYSAQGDFLHKVTPTGDLLWSKPYKGMKIHALPDNGFVAFTGQIEGLKLIRFDENGTMIWEKSIPNASNYSSSDGQGVNIFNYDMDYIVYTILTVDDSYNYGMEISVFDINGVLVNSNTINGFERFHDVTTLSTNDNGILIVRTGQDFVQNGNNFENEYYFDILKFSNEDIFN